MEPTHGHSSTDRCCFSARRRFRCLADSIVVTSLQRNFVSTEARVQPRPLERPSRGSRRDFAWGHLR